MTAGGAENWPGFRGPRADGSSAEPFLAPARIEWKVKLPGPGHSSPTVWGDRVFLTAFEPETSVLGRIAGTRGRLLVIALNTKDGSTLWTREIGAKQIEKTTNVNQPASPTPATDGERVYAYFGSKGVSALSARDGSIVWEAPIGPHPHHMGSGASPVLAGGRILLNAETDGPSDLYSIDVRDGRIVWRTPRKTRQAGYSTAVVWGESVVTAGHESVMAYSLAGGRPLWTRPGLSTYVVPSPVAAGGLLYATSNGPGGNVVMALRRDGSVAWSAAKGGAYVASPVVHGGRLYTVNINCVASCLDARNGRLIWQQRLPETNECYASPVVASGRLHVVDTRGTLITFDAADSFQARGRIDLGERVLASPAIAGGRMLVRSDGHLFAVSPNPP